MATMDVFNAKPFDAMEMTAAINRRPYRPSFLGSLNLFTPKRIRTKAAMVEEKNGTLSIIQTSERGAPLEEGKSDKRNVRYFNTTRIARGHTITADEIQSIRAFGTESELMQVQQKVAEVLDGSTGLRAAVELTHENMRLGAVQGKVLDADGSTIIDWFSEWGITQDTEIDFDLDNASPASGAVRKKCNQVVRQTMKAMGGLWVPGQTSIVAICGDNFWDDLTAHKEVRETYLNTQQAADLRDNVGAAYESFRYGGITWVNYRGTDDGTTVAVGTDKAKFFPVNAPGVFDVAFSPAETFDFVNTPGKNVYAMIVRDKDRNAWVRPEIYSYPLHICTTPKALQRAKRT